MFGLWVGYWVPHSTDNPIPKKNWVPMYVKNLIKDKTYAKNELFALLALSLRVENLVKSLPAAADAS